MSREAAGAQEPFVCSKLRGVVAVHGSRVDDIGRAFASHVPGPCCEKRAERDGKHFHLTLLSPDEAKICASEADVSKHFGALAASDLFPIGVGTANDAFYCVVESPVVQKIRKSLGLKPKDLHITLGFLSADVHDKCKNATTLVNPSGVKVEVVKKALKVYVEVGEVEENLPILLLAQGIDSPSVALWVDLARAKAAGQSEAFDDMVALCEKHTDAADGGFHAGYLLGFALMKLKRFEEAAAALDKAQDEQRDDVHATLAKKVDDMHKFCLGKSEGRGLMFKFPRTHHIFDAGGSGVTRDDLILDKADAASYLNRQIYVEEKIDGANLGIWLDSDYSIRCQNRSHFVTSESGTQWKGLQQWLDGMAGTLSTLLDPRRHILFGEWMYAKHSIEYDSLPSYFVAFDLYDIHQRKFYSRRRLYQLLAGTGIALVPMVHSGPVASLETFREMLETPSAFKSNRTPVEGVYIREDDAEGAWLVRRCKLVRPDFIQGIETHWMVQSLVKNKVDIEFAYQHQDRACEIRDQMLADSHNAAPPTKGQAQGQVAAGPATGPPAGADDFPFAVGEYTEPRSVVTGSNGVALPRNFGFVSASLALSSIPKTQAQCAGMAVDMIVTLTDEERLPPEWFAGSDGLTNLYVPVPNYQPPSAPDMDAIGEAVEGARARNGRHSVMVHCGGGKGRAGTVAACLLLRDAILRDAVPSSARPDDDVSSSAGVVAFLRRLRPGCVETETQEAFIRQYADRLWALKARSHDDDDDDAGATSTAAPGPEEAPAQGGGRVQGGGGRKLQPRVLMLCGLPGSGKSTLAHRLVAKGGAGGEGRVTWTRASQDDHGKSEVQEIIREWCKRKFSDPRQRLVIDMCNVDATVRGRWLESLREWQPALFAKAKAKSDLLVALHLQVSPEVCKARVKARSESGLHPTIKGDGSRIVDAMVKVSAVPTVSEGFSHVISARDETEIEEVLLRLS